MSYAIRTLLLTLLVAVMAVGSFAASEVAVSVDCTGKGAPILPTYLGAHLHNIPSDEMTNLIDRRFPSHGLTDGAMFRVLYIPGTYISPSEVTWWSHIQADPKSRKFLNDAWELLDLIERMRGTTVMYAQGFPYQSKEVSMAFIAFCNGDPSDQRPIGVDYSGFDWKTVGHWAAIRAAGDERHPAHPKPYGVHYWEIGNEIYNPGVSWMPEWMKLEDKQDNAGRARLYIEGREFNGRHYGGFLEFYKAMRWVDPSIEVGAILGMEASWKGYAEWNQVVIDATKELPGVFYTFHSYTGSKKDSDVDAMAAPQRVVVPMIEGTQRRLAAAGLGGATLIDSEWHPYEPATVGSVQMVGALTIADELGVLIEHGVHGQCLYGPYDTKWKDGGSFATIVRSTETDMWRRPAGFRWPAYYAFTLFTGATGRALPTTCAADRATDVAAYAMKRKDGLQVVVINKQGSARDLRINLANLTGAPATAQVDEVYPAKNNLNSEDVVFNNIDMSTDAAQKIDDLFAVAPAATPKISNGRIAYQVKPYSITRFRIQAPSAGR